MGNRMDKYNDSNVDNIPKRSDRNKELYKQIYNAYDEFENLVVPSNAKEIDLSTSNYDYIAEKLKLIDFSKWKETEVEAPDIFGLPYDLCVTFVDANGVYHHVKHYANEGFEYLENYQVILDVLSEIDKLADIKPKYKKYPPKPTGEWEHIEK